MAIFQPKLNQACRNRGARNPGKGCGRCDVYRRRRAKDWVVEEIEDIGAEGELMRFLHSESLLQRDVPILLIGRAPGITWGGAPASSLCAGAVRQRRRHTETFPSQVAVKALFCCAARVSVGDAAAEKLRGAPRRAEEAAAGAVSDRERQALLIGDDTAYGPTTENRIVHKAVSLHRNLVCITHDETMRPIKVATRFVFRGVILIVIDVAAILSGASCIQFVCTQRAADIVFGLRVSVGALEVETAMQPARKSGLPRTIIGKTDVAGITRTAFARQTDNLVTQFLVVHRVGGDGVRSAGVVANRDRTRRAG